MALDPAGRIIGAFAGDPVGAHRAGVAFNRREAGRHLDAPVDGIIVNSHPMDLNFKQSMKCVGKQLVRQYELFFHVPRLSAEAIARLGFFRHYAEPQQVIEAGRKALGSRARVAVFPEGGATFPVPGDRA